MTSALLNSAAESLPVELFPFIGRKEDITRLCSLLGDPAVRLVTILGPGGTGKTRLALELGRLLRPAFASGVVFVSLADLNTAAEILPALARALGVLLLPGSDLRQVVFDHLSARQMLLVLDNFEQLVDGALLVRDLLAAAPQVKVLATSHEKLNLTGETIYHLQGLELPPVEIAFPAGEYDAARLFVQKARQASPGFKLEDANAPAVLRICRLVDGTPLGILLAAAWVELFSLAEIADQIEQNLDFLSAEARDLPARHRSLRAVFDAAYDRLDSNLQGIFIQLSIFRGGFTLPAAKAVAAAELKALLALVEKSLLRRDPSTARYSLHSLLAQFALEKLVAAGGYPGLREAHAAYYLDLLCRSETALKSEAQLATLDAIQADLENIRLAWTWAVEKGDFHAIQRAAKSLYAFCDMRGRHYEGEILFRQAWQSLAPAPGQPTQPALALVLLSWYDQHDYIDKLAPSAGLDALAEACLEQAQAAGNPEALAASLVLSGALAEQKGECAAALQFYQQGHLADPTLDAFYWVDLRIGICHQQMGQYDLALQDFQHSFERSTALGERVKTGWSLFNTGETLFLQGKLEEASACLRQARDLFQQTGTPFGFLWCDYDLARISLAGGSLDQARQLAEAALQIARQAQAAPMVRRFTDLLAQINAAPARVPKPTPAGDLLESLSERELEVLRLLKSDLSGPEIASQLMVSLNTVRYHTKNIYQKLQVNTRRQALARARELGL